MELAQKAHGRPVGHAGRVYTSNLLSKEELAELNESLARFETDPQAGR